MANGTGRNLSALTRKVNCLYTKDIKLSIMIFKIIYAIGHEWWYIFILIYKGCNYGREYSERNKF